MTVKELYESTIKNRPLSDQMELVKLIVSHLPAESIVDFNTEWSDEDLNDARRYSASTAEARLD